MRNKLTLIQSNLTVTTETVQTDHMALRTLEDHDHVPDRQRDVCGVLDLVCVDTLFCACASACVFYMTSVQAMQGTPLMLVIMRSRATERSSSEVGWDAHFT